MKILHNWLVSHVIRWTFEQRAILLKCLDKTCTMFISCTQPRRRLCLKRLLLSHRVAVNSPLLFNFAAQRTDQRPTMTSTPAIPWKLTITDIFSHLFKFLIHKAIPSYRLVSFFTLLSNYFILLLCIRTTR